MGEVTKLPDTMHRQWRVYEGRLRAGLLDAGASAEETDFALGRLKPVYLEAASPAMFTVGERSMDQVVAELNVWVKTQIGALLQHIAARDVLLFRAGVES